MATTARRRQPVGQILEANRGILLDIGCGESKQPRAVGLDIRDLPGVDIVHNWNDIPWPLPDESVLTIVASHVVEHVNPADGHFLRWMDECWRILRPDGQLAIATPYPGSSAWWRDPTHCNGWNEQTALYFDPDYEQAYAQYKPRPWKIELNLFTTREGDGLMEVAMRKRST